MLATANRIGRDFVLAGKAIFTVKSVTGQYYTYKVSHKEAQGNFGEAYFVSLLTGPDNGNDYTYLGMLHPADGWVKLTKKSTYNDNSLPVKVIRWAMGVIWEEMDLPAGYVIHHVGKCGRCGRALTVPESIESGFGPECITMI